MALQLNRVHEQIPAVFIQSKSLVQVGIGYDPPTVWSIVDLVFGDFDAETTRKWMDHHWTICLYFIVPYYLFVKFGPELMRNRKPMNLKWAIAAWNFGLAMFSIVACYIILPEFFRVLMQPNGFHNSICEPASTIGKVYRRWGWLFTLSKLVELGDTIFLVLKKRNVIFLHWFHHITVLLYCWYSYSAQLSSARWFICVNFSIHALMYTYYGLRAVGVHVPKPLAMTLTAIQLSQMAVGVTLNVYAYRMKLHGIECDMPLRHIYLGFLMYVSYFILFANFFRKVYLNKFDKSVKKK